MSTRTITIDATPSTNKDVYDTIVERGVDDLEWVGPAKATGIEILYADKQMIPGRSFARPDSKNPNRWVFHAVDHGTVLVKQARVGKGVEIEYTIVVHWPAPKRDDVIDPFVKILP